MSHSSSENRTVKTSSALLLLPRVWNGTNKHLLSEWGTEHGVRAVSPEQKGISVLFVTSQRAHF